MATQIEALPKLLTSIRPSPLPTATRGEDGRPSPGEVGLPAKGSKCPHRENGVEVNHLVVKTIPLVYRVAMETRRRLPLHIELDDLVNTGVLGLINAVQKFDPRMQVNLEQYARHRIRGAILDGLRELDNAPRGLRTAYNKAKRAHRELQAALGRPPTDEEIAKGLGMSLAGWYRRTRDMLPLGVDWLRPLGSMGVKEARVAAEGDLPADNESHQFDACYRRERKEILHQAIGRIPEQERQVVQFYYQKELTMREIGARLGVSESRVSQLHASALGHLRQHVESFLANPSPPASSLGW